MASSAQASPLSPVAPTQEGRLCDLLGSMEGPSGTGRQQRRQGTSGRRTFSRVPPQPLFPLDVRVRGPVTITTHPEPTALAPDPGQKGPAGCLCICVSCVRGGQGEMVPKDTQLPDHLPHVSTPRSEALESLLGVGVSTWHLHSPLKLRTALPRRCFPAGSEW
ncbi:unnamed protein product [Rangifer tarandus platyrhynchus]|uniref:Uncharacterized protein n=1 Tax=Rangifer tarandus platyrhynchus TaxID=3082113 RepID=A0ABN8ZS52_RANTA|nr:unnamed protein product [Rangifer tarandus platyrhynchus]